MKEYQKEYEEYMKSITDGFAKLCSFEGAESILAGEGNKLVKLLLEQEKSPPTSRGDPSKLVNLLL